MHTIIAAFSEEHTHRLTGVTQSQMRYWHRTGLFSPSLSDRIYTFRDIVSLRVLGVLRNQYQVSLQHLRKVSDRLARSTDDRWTGVRLYVIGKKVAWQEPGSDRPQEIVSRQYVLPTIQLEGVVSDTRRDIASLNARSEEQIGKIKKSRTINRNAAVIAGTRIRVLAIKRFHEAGYSVAQIIKEYPDINVKDVEAALNYADDRAAA